MIIREDVVWDKSGNLEIGARAWGSWGTPSQPQIGLKVGAN